MNASNQLLRKAFRVLNRGFMVPAFRLGLGPLVVNPLAGYIMVIKHRGHKSGKLRYTPVNYAIADGCVYALAGFGKSSHWVKNMTADPQVELLLPSAALACKAEVVDDEQERLRMLRQVLINSGFAAVLFEGIRPARISEQKLAELSKRYVVWRFKPLGIGAGVIDPGGWAWVWPILAIAVLIWRLLK